MSPDYADHPNEEPEWKWNCLQQKYFEWKKYFAVLVLVRIQLAFPVRHPPSVGALPSDLADEDIVVRALFGEDAALAGAYSADTACTEFVDAETNKFVDFLPGHLDTFDFVGPVAEAFAELIVVEFVIQPAWAFVGRDTASFVA